MSKQPMNQNEIDRIIEDAANRALPPDEVGAAIERAQSAVLRDLRPVKPLPGPWILSLMLTLLYVFLATGVAFFLGMHGIEVRSPFQRSLIFPALLLAGWIAGAACAREMRPASGLRLATLAYILAAVAFPVIFSVVFTGYSREALVAEGVPCLVAGMKVSLPTALVIAWILRSGFVLDWSMAGLAAGTLSGITGLGMLELHCVNLKAIHVITWHVAVVVLSGALGWAIGAIADYWGRRRINTPGI